MQEDLLRLVGLNNNSARIYVELNKVPTTIEEAVHYVVHYFEAARNPHHGYWNEDGQERSQRTRQVKSDNKSKKESSEHKKQKTEKTEIGKQKDKTVKFTCLLYTSDAADDMQCVDLGGRRIIKK